MRSKLVTIFGGSGFVGRYLVRALAESGARIRVAVRRPEQALFLKPMGDVGQIVLVPANVRDDESVASAVVGADAVVNLAAILFERGRQRFPTVHVEGAGRVARAAREAGVRRLVHVSALGANPGAPSNYAQSRATGEDAVREAFPDATILRPSIIFGSEAGFFHLMALLARFSPVLPLIGGGNTRFRPVYVGDVARAIVRALESPKTAGITFEIAGPEIYTLRELTEAALRACSKRRLLVPVPYFVATAEAAILEMLHIPLLTVDQVRQLRSDNLPSGDLPGLADLGIAANGMEAVLPSYLAQYRRPGVRHA